jgi:hypothetical protein
VTEAALARYDDLPPVRPDRLRGLWRGEGVPTGHPLDGTLERLGWFGKRFEDDDAVHPLVFRAPGGLVRVNPALVPLRAVVGLAPLLRTAPAAAAFAAVRPLLVTRRPRARLREIRYRGVVSAAVVYDDLPVVDALRAEDDGAVLGAMDARWLPRPYLFRLRRVG